MAKKKVAKKKDAKKPLPKKSAASKMPDMPDLTQMRGVSNFDTEESAILIRATCADVAKAFKKRKLLKTWVRNALGKFVTIGGASYLVYQLNGHPWVTINGFTGGKAGRQGAKVSPQDDAKALSKSLATGAIYFGTSDTSCVTEYDLYENGKHIEHFDDFNGINFSSQIRDVEAPEDGPDVYTFVDAFIPEQDAFVPGWSQFLFEGWRHKKDDKVKLDFGGVLNDKVVERLDFVSA